MSFALHHRTTSEEPPRIWTQAEIRDRTRRHRPRPGARGRACTRATTDRGRDLVHLSGRVLYGLTYFPTGAIVAAPTTSLPETPGGSRNWDYRYTWVRDASFTLQALWVAACPDEAGKFFDYLADTATAQVRNGADLQIMFGIGGEHDLTERELGAPVRLAEQQPGAHRQRRVEPAPARRLRRAARRRVPAARPARPSSNRATRRFLADLADIAAARWQRARPGHLGDPGRAPPLPLLEADVLGRARPRDRPRRPPRRGRPGRPMEGDPRRDRRRDHDPRLERAGRRLHAVVRPRRARRLEPDDADRRVHPGRPPAHAGDDRRDRRPTSPTSAGWSTATAAPTGSRARRARSCCARSGSPTLGARPARSTARATTFESRRRLRERRRSALGGGRHRAPASSSATSRRRSATSASSTRPGRSPRPSSGARTRDDLAVVRWPGDCSPGVTSPASAGAASPSADRLQHQQQQTGAQEGDQQGAPAEIAETFRAHSLGDRAADQRAEHTDHQRVDAAAPLLAASPTMQAFRRSARRRSSRRCSLAALYETAVAPGRLRSGGVRGEMAVRRRDYSLTGASHTAARSSAASWTRSGIGRRSTPIASTC